MPDCRPVGLPECLALEDGCLKFCCLIATGITSPVYGLPHLWLWRYFWWISRRGKEKGGENARKKMKYVEICMWTKFGRCWSCRFRCCCCLADCLFGRSNCCTAILLFNSSRTGYGISRLAENINNDLFTHTHTHMREGEFMKGARGRGRL